MARRALLVAVTITASLLAAALFIRKTGNSSSIALKDISGGEDARDENALQTWLSHTQKLRTQQLQQQGGAVWGSRSAVGGRQPVGYIMKDAKRIHAILDVAAPLDAGTEATVPGIIKPVGYMATLPVQAAVPTPQQLYYPQQTQQIYAYTPPQQATVSALQAAQGGAAAAESSVAGPAQATQLAERNSEGGELDDRTVQRGPVAGNSWIRGRVQQLAENVGGEDPAPDTYDSPGQYVSYTVQPNYPAPPLAMLPPPIPTTPSAVLTAPGAPQPAYPVREVPNFFNPPFREWDDEDAAQHAYNLAQWRVKILQAKLLQAKLRRRLLGTGTKAVQMEAVSKAPQGRDGRRLRMEIRREMRRMTRRTAMQVKSVQKQVLTLAQETTKALRALKSKLNHSCKDCAPGSVIALRGHQPATESELVSLSHETKRDFRAILRRLAVVSSGTGDRETDDEEGIQGGVRKQENLWTRVSGDV